MVTCGVRGLQQGKLILHAHQRLVVAMAMQHDLPPMPTVEAGNRAHAG